MDQPSISCFLNTRLLHIYIPIFFAFLLHRNVWDIRRSWLFTSRIPTEKKLNCSGILQHFLLQFLSSAHFCKDMSSLTIPSGDQKSGNLQYNTLGCWVNGTIVSLTKRLMFQVLFFFMISCKILCRNPFNLFSYFFL